MNNFEQETNKQMINYEITFKNINLIYLTSNKKEESFTMKCSYVFSDTESDKMKDHI